MQKQSMTIWIISIVIGIITSIVATLITQNIWLMTSIMLATFLCIIAVLLYRQIETIDKNSDETKELITVKTLEISKSIDRFYNSPCSLPPQCCELINAGFYKVADDVYKSVGMNLENITKSYKFLGVSAEFLLQEKNFRSIVKQKTTKEDCRFQILLLDPDAKELVEKHRITEGFYKNPEAMILRLKHSIAEFKDLANECDGKVEIRLYRERPVFRLILIDDKLAFINFYGAKDMTGVQTPQIVFVKTEQSFFIAFNKFYNRILSESKTIEY